MRRTVFRVADDRLAVIECGYMNSASADPSPRLAYAQCCISLGTNAPVGLPSTGFGVAIFASAAPKIASQPPNFEGR